MNGVFMSVCFCNDNYINNVTSNLLQIGILGAAAVHIAKRFGDDWKAKQYNANNVYLNKT